MNSRNIYLMSPSNIVGVPRHLQNTVYNDGATAWILTAGILVLFMTIPGLAIFYGGMVSSKNVLAVCMQAVSICCLITILWLAFGYSLAFCPSGYFTPSQEVIDHTSVFGDSSRFWLRGMTINSYNQIVPNVPEAAFCFFQLTFAIISPALICGSIADRMKYWSMLTFMGLWSLCVYCPIAHSVWHPNGFLFKLGVLDWAGGNAIETASGVSGLVAALVLGNRKGWAPRDFDSHPPHNILLTYMGMCMLWCGWMGFNGGGSGSSARNSYAIMASQIAASTGAMTWMIIDALLRGKPSVLGIINGAIAALVAITPAAGYVDMNGAFWVGMAGGFFCYFGIQMKHYIFKIDDSLDAFGVHGIGGIVGLILTGFFATDQVTENTDQNGVFYANTWVGGHLLGKQIASICFTVSWCTVGTFILLKLVDKTLGLRVTEDEEVLGLDSSLHGETMHAENSKHQKDGLQPTEAFLASGEFDTSKMRVEYSIPRTPSGNKLMPQSSDEEFPLGFIKGEDKIAENDSISRNNV